MAVRAPAKYLEESASSEVSQPRPRGASRLRKFFFLACASLTIAGLALGLMLQTAHTRESGDRAPQPGPGGKNMLPSPAAAVPKAGISPIDLAAPARTETATFALG